MKFVEITDQNKIRYIKLNRPEVRNAFHPTMIAELTNAFEELSRATDVRVAVLKGNGESFCAGADLNWMKSMVAYSFEENIEDSKKLHKMFLTVRNCSVPVIAYLHGHVMGGAIGLAAVCDVVLAEKDTRFAFSEVRLGLAPAVISAFALEKMPLSLAKELMLTGKNFDAALAKEAGLINHSGTNNEMDERLKKIIKHFYNSGVEAYKETKKLLNQQSNINFEQIEELTTRVIAERRISEEGQEGLNSFFDKRKASWTYEAN